MNEEIENKLDNPQVDASPKNEEKIKGNSKHSSLSSEVNVNQKKRSSIYKILQPKSVTIYSPPMDEDTQIVKPVDSKDDFKKIELPKHDADIFYEQPDFRLEEASIIEEVYDDVEDDKDVKEGETLYLESRASSTSSQTLLDKKRASFDRKLKSKSDIKTSVSVLMSAMARSKQALELTHSQDVVVRGHESALISQDEYQDKLLEIACDLDQKLSEIDKAEKYEDEEEAEKLDEQILIEEEQEVWSDEGEEEQEEEVDSIIDRSAYYTTYISIKDVHDKEKVKNNTYQRKMVEYFKKRHMEHVFKEYHTTFDATQKYKQLLNKFGQLLELKEVQTELTRNEIKDMKDTKERNLNEIQDITKAMLHKERDIGIGLINRKTGNPIPDKFVEYLIRRQSNKIKEMSKLRLTFIKLRNMVTEKEEALERIEHITPKLTLHIYQQLKIENRVRADKLELQDYELNKLRLRCRDAMQCLAHMREKCSALAVDIVDLQQQDQESEMELKAIREEVVECRTMRDKYRAEYEKLRENSGLLTENTLLRDFEDSVQEIVKLNLELDRLKNVYIIKTEQVRVIRKNLEDFKQSKKHKPEKKKQKGTKAKEHVAYFTPFQWKRPSIIQTKVPAFQNQK